MTDQSDKKRTTKALLAVKMYRLHFSDETVVPKAVLASLVMESDRGRQMAVDLLHEMCDDESAPLRHAVGRRAVEMAERDDPETMHDWVAAYVAENDATGEIEVPFYDYED